MFIDSAQIETGTNMFAAWLFTNSTSDGFKISFSSGFTPDGVLSNPAPVNVSKGQMAKIKNAVERDYPFEVKPAPQNRVKVYVY